MREPFRPCEGYLSQTLTRHVFLVEFHIQKWFFQSAVGSEARVDALVSRSRLFSGHFYSQIGGSRKASLKIFSFLSIPFKHAMGEVDDTVGKLHSEVF